MIWSLRLRILCKTTAALYLRNGIHINTVLFARRRAPRAIPYKTGIRNYEKNLEIDSEFHGLSSEYGLDENFDMTKTEEAYDLHVWEQKKERKRIQYKIIEKKFFAPRPQPLMLTWNERQCIKYLHDKDPVQWNIKSLSESFPATPDTVKKIIKSRKKISPERAKLLDLKAQKNWELLAEGKLDADSHVLEHLKKFVNRREVLLEQINNTNFYLPEVKKEPVWNQGEMSKILVGYDKALKKLAAEAHQSENPKILNDGISEEKNTMAGKKNNLDLIHEEIEEQCRKVPKLKETFVIKGIVNAYKKNITLEELEKTILKKSDTGEKLDLVEKAVLDSKLGVSNSENITYKNENNGHRDYNLSSSKSEEKENNLHTPYQKKSSELEGRIYMKTDKKSASNKFKTNVSKNKLVPVDNRLQFTDETGIGKILNENLSLKKTEITEEKPKIDFSDPVRLQNEKVYYDQQVSDIKNTAFWNNNRRSKEKAITESNKEAVEIPAFSNKEGYISKTVIFSRDVYPERIKIPKNKQGSGLTFRIKDCYYDDDGKFLYRVPGMIK